MAGYRECFEQAVSAVIAGATVLTENTRSARALYAVAERRLRLFSRAWLTPDVLPYGAFVERLYSDALVLGAIDVHSLQREQELQLWRQIVERSPGGREMLLTDSAAALAASSFRTAAEYNIALDSPLHSLNVGASSDARAFFGWAAEFRRQLESHGWTCAALLSRQLAPSLPSLRLPAQLFVFLADPTPAQRTFLSALAESGVQVSFADYAPAGNIDGHRFTDEALLDFPLPDSPLFDSPLFDAPLVDAPLFVEPAPGSVPVRFEFDDVSAELRTAAQWARQQLESSPEARIGIILFDLDRKLPLVQNAFRSVLHPEHLFGRQAPLAFEIASPLALSEYPVVRCALQLLSLFAAPIDFDSFHSMLSAPYFSESCEDAAKFLSRVRQHARLQVSFEEFSQWLNESHELPHLRGALRSLPRHSALSSEQAPAYWVDLSFRILKAFGWPGSSTDGAPHRIVLDSEEYQCTQSFRELLVSLSSLELLDWRTDFRGFVARLQRTAASQNFKPETRNAPVQIMDVTESEGSIFDALWIGSCSDDLWPDAPKVSPLIPVALQKTAGVPLVGTPEADARIHRITSRLLQSAPTVSLSLALRTDDEREQRWSPFFSAFPIATEAIHMPSSPAGRFATATLDAISDSIAPAVGATEIARGGTSLLQDQSTCPFRAFAIRRLLATEAEGPNDALAPTERGNIVDRALQLIWEQLHDSKGLHAATSGDRPELPGIVAAAVDSAMLTELPPASDAWTARFRKLERERSIEVLTEWLALESARKPFHVIGHQLKVEVELAGLTLHGRLDRLDEIDDAHVVIDYKTGGSLAVNAWQVPRPRMPQLPFYALAMQQQKFNLAGISFAVVRKGEPAFKAFLREKNNLPCPDPAKRCFDGMTFDEYAQRWNAELKIIAGSFVQGHAAVDPKIPPGKGTSTCKHCHLQSLCRIGFVAELDSDCVAEGEDDE